VEANYARDATAALGLCDTSEATGACSDGSAAHCESHTTIHVIHALLLAFEISGLEISELRSVRTCPCELQGTIVRQNRRARASFASDTSDVYV
jgi:hypothetical protein